jgi:hypothetical protein
MKKETSEFDAVADELYRLKPDQFITARNAKAAGARTAGNRALAEAIKELRRPSTSAWLANWLVHERPDAFGRLQSLGTSMRDASGRLAGDELRQLSRQRHEVLAALTAEARLMASGAGVEFSSAVSSEFEATLMAALSDEDAATALGKGRLTTALRSTGFGSLGPVSGAGPTRKSRAERPTAESQSGAGPTRKSRVERPTAESQRALKEAERLLEAARKESSKQERQAKAARARRDDARQSVHDLEVQLEDLRELEAKANTEATAADENCSLAQEAVTAVEEQVNEARRRLD